MKIDKETVKRNEQIYPARTRIEMNDKITKTVFNLNEEVFFKLVNGQKVLGVDELQSHPKFGTITSYVQIFNSEGAAANEPLNQFDRAVFNVLISQKLSGNVATTPKVIFRGLTGKIANNDFKMYPNQQAAIMRSIIRLMSTTIRVDMTDACAKLGYNDGEPLKRTNNIFPCEIIEARVNGQDATVIFFKDDSPLYETASAKNQILRYDPTWLNAPTISNTPRNIAIKNYLMTRVMEILSHKLTPTLTFKKIFEKCGLATAGVKAKFDARQVVIAFFEHLYESGVISEFDLRRAGNLHQSVTFLSS